jgi:fermentation-respiration switch protein FrsA (DUF1100 family)
MLDDLKKMVGAPLKAISGLAKTDAGSEQKQSAGHRVYDRVLLHPLGYPIGRYHLKHVEGVELEDVYFPSGNGQLLHGWFFHQVGARRTALVSHGIGGNITSRIDLIELILKSGANVFIYDYQGYGRSKGSASLRHIADDGKAAYAYLVGTKSVHPDDVILYGESLGTGVSCRILDEHPACAVVLQSPFVSLARRCAEILPLLQAHPILLEAAAGFDTLSTLSRLHPPLLIVHGLEDRTIPVAHAEELFKHASEPKSLLTIPGAAHTGDRRLMFSEMYLDAVRSFVQRLSHRGA